jgi:hypothetical protein
LVEDDSFWAGFESDLDDDGGLDVSDDLGVAGLEEGEDEADSDLVDDFERSLLPFTGIGVRLLGLEDLALPLVDEGDSSILEPLLGEFLPLFDRFGVSDLDWNDFFWLERRDIARWKGSVMPDNPFEKPFLVFE